VTVQEILLVANRVSSFVCCNRDLFVISLKMVVYSPKQVGVSVKQILLLVPALLRCCMVSVGGHFNVCTFCECNLLVALLFCMGVKLGR